MDQKFENGQTVYLPSGEEVVYIQWVCTNHHVVQELLHMDEGDEPGEIIVVKEVFAEPPTHKMADAITRLDAQIRQRREELRQIESKLLTSNEEMASRKSVLQMHDALKNLELYVQGKVTHIVELNEPTQLPTILKWPEECAMKDWRGRDSAELRLVTVSGRTKKGLSLTLNQYSDGSGTGKACFLCISEEEAKARFAESATRVFDYFDKHPDASPYDFFKWETTCTEMGVTIPDFLSLRVNSQNYDANMKKIQEHEKALSIARAVVDELGPKIHKSLNF